MITMVDETKGKTPIKFGYTNKAGDVEYVEVWNKGELLDIHYGGDEAAVFYTADIDNLIKALQAAKDSLTKES